MRCELCLTLSAASFRRAGGFAGVTIGRGLTSMSLGGGLTRLRCFLVGGDGLIVVGGSSGTLEFFARLISSIETIGRLRFPFSFGPSGVKKVRRILE